MNSKIHRSPVILVVDDDVNLTRVLRIVLSTQGYTPYVAHNGVEGLAQAEASKPDLILSDLEMPVMGGLEFCRHLRNRSAVPLIVLTGAKDTDLQWEAIEAGANMILNKPFVMSTLLEQIETCLAASPLLAAS